MPLDPQAATFLAEAAAAGDPPVEALSIADARLSGLGFLDLQGEPEEVARVVHRFIPGPTADLPVRIYYPDGEGPFPAVVWFHGSGWVICNLDVNDVPARALTNRSGCVVIAVNYQKAPEHPFPVPFDDCWATLQWVRANAVALGVDPARIAVGGDSSGGNLAAAVALRIRRRGRPGLVPGADLPGHGLRPRHAVVPRECGGLPAQSRVDALVLGQVPRRALGRREPVRVTPARRLPRGVCAGVHRHRRIRSAARRRGAGTPTGCGAGRRGHALTALRRHRPRLLPHGRGARPGARAVRRDGRGVCGSALSA